MDYNDVFGIFIIYTLILGNFFQHDGSSSLPWFNKIFFFFLVDDN